MRLVWKCDHCSFIHEDREKVLQHEKKCLRNSEMRACWTCEHHVDEAYPPSVGMYVCKKGHDFDFMEEKEDKGNCPDWEHGLGL